MTGDDLPAASPPGAGAKPEVRASDEDRDRVVEILRVAAGDGRLTAAELDERLGAALTARTSGELTALTADLPEVAGHAGGIAARAKDVVRLDYQGGNTTRRGRWMVPQRMEIRAVGGTVKLDFTDAVITSPTLQIQAEVRGGRLVLVTKPGIEVDADDVAVHGGGVKVRPEHGWDAPVRLKIEVSGQARGGATSVTQWCYRPVDPAGKWGQSRASRRALWRFLCMTRRRRPNRPRDRTGGWGVANRRRGCLTGPRCCWWSLRRRARVRVVQVAGAPPVSGGRSRNTRKSGGCPRLARVRGLGR